MKAFTIIETYRCPIHGTTTAGYCQECELAYWRTRERQPDREWEAAKWEKQVTPEMIQNLLNRFKQPEPPADYQI